MPGTLSSQNHTETDLDHEAGGQNMNISRFESLGEPEHLSPLLCNEKIHKETSHSLKMHSWK